MKKCNNRYIIYKYTSPKGKSYIGITGEYVGTWLVKTICQRHLGLNNGKISSCLKGKRNHHKFYIFKHIDDPTVVGVEFNDDWLDNIKRSPNVDL